MAQYSCWLNCKNTGNWQFGICMRTRLTWNNKKHSRLGWHMLWYHLNWSNLEKHQFKWMNLVWGRYLVNKQKCRHLSYTLVLLHNIEDYQVKVHQLLSSKFPFDIFLFMFWFGVRFMFFFIQVWVYVRVQDRSSR